MRSFAIVADSTSDLCLAMRQRYDIDYVPMNYVINGEEIKASLDWETHSAKEYYDLMRNGTIIKTTQVSRQSFTECFTSYVNKGMDVLYISCSSALSGSVNLAQLIAREITAEHPEAHIICVDSLISSLGQGLLCIKACECRAEGKSLEETAAYIESIKLTVNQCGTPATLDYLRRAGRVTASTAIFGNLFGVKPLIISDRIGQNFAVKKAKGTLNAKREIAKMVADYVIDSEHQCLYISHADCPEEAEALRDEIQKLVGFESVYIDYIGPIVGASVGPGTVISFCVGREVTIEGKE